MRPPTPGLLQRQRPTHFGAQTLRTTFNIMLEEAFDIQAEAYKKELRNSIVFLDAFAIVYAANCFPAFMAKMKKRNLFILAIEARKQLVA
ncbi:hypothetical protein L1987_83828 [Smallanthus sonchifolius]|uniref:Uncharacterized protein n=1 Tax=Smallanthus sonchifolius TaxID=185202 RepID=A0ACB8YD07_9ASTR|nr:hypothetical protein L1987_83828 [Smallanthus sonchifolius]